MDQTFLTGKQKRDVLLFVHFLSQRASFCPFKHLSMKEGAAIPLDVLDRGVDVGVAILLQSANQKVLLTRRASGLRIFPNVWVPPGTFAQIFSIRPRSTKAHYQTANNSTLLSQLIITAQTKATMLSLKVEFS